MNTYGKKVIHNHFGEGVIVDDFYNINDSKFVHIKFSNNRVFRFYTNSLLTGAFSFVDPKISLMLGNPEKSMLLSMLNKNGFEGFHHYTDFKNFIKIMNSGYLYCRALVEKIGFRDSAEKSIIDHTQQSIKEKVRFYYKEKTPTLYRNEGIKKDIANSIYSAHMPIPVLLLFEEDVIFHNLVAFSNGGCGNSKTIITENPKEAMEFDWNGIFRRGPYGISRTMGKEEYFSFISNQRNAEFHYPKRISIAHLKAIVFRSVADKKHAEYVLGCNPLYMVNSEKFNVTSEDLDRNYLMEYNISSRNDVYNVRLIFCNNPAGYSHKLIFYRKDGTKKEEDFSNRIDEFRIPHTNNELHFSCKIISSTERIEYCLNGNVCAIWEG